MAIASGKCMLETRLLAIFGGEVGRLFESFDISNGLGGLVVDCVAYR